MACHRDGWHMRGFKAASLGLHRRFMAIRIRTSIWIPCTYTDAR